MRGVPSDEKRLTKLENYKGKPPGPQSRFVRRRFTDLRTKEGKELAAIIAAIESDLGNVRPGQRILLENLRAKIAIVRAIGKWIDRKEGGVIRENGELLPILARNFLSYSNEVRRSILALYALAERKPPALDLESYIAEQQAAKKSSDDGNGEAE